MNNLVASTICTLSLVIGIFSLMENELFSSKRKRRFIILALIIIFEIVIDTISFELNGNTKYIQIYRALKILEFSVVPIIPTILAYSTSRKSFWKKISKYFYALIIFNLVMQLITFFVPLIFKIDNDAVYSRTRYTLMYVGILVIAFLLLIVTANNAFIQNTAGINFTLILTNVFLGIGLVLRGFSLKTNADWLCITISYFIFLLYFANSYLKLDPTTSLLNKRAYNNRLSRINYTTAIVVFDANNFKTINDTYGHQCGDFALLKIAEAILEIYGEIGFCYRVGGDEFCVIFKPNMLKKLIQETPNYDTYMLMKNLSNSLDQMLREYSNEHQMLEYGVSQGFGIYYSKSDTPTHESYKPIEEVVKIADKRMYKAKKEYKQQSLEA